MTQLSAWLLHVTCSPGHSHVQDGQAQDPISQGTGGLGNQAAILLQPFRSQELDISQVQLAQGLSAGRRNCRGWQIAGEDPYIWEAS